MDNLPKPEDPPHLINLREEANKELCELTKVQLDIDDYWGLEYNRYHQARPLERGTLTITFTGDVGDLERLGAKLGLGGPRV